MEAYTSVMLASPSEEEGEMEEGEEKNRWRGHRKRRNKRNEAKTRRMDVDVTAVCFCQANSCNRRASGSPLHSGFYHTAYKLTAADSQQ